MQNACTFAKKIHTNFPLITVFGQSIHAVNSNQHWAELTKHSDPGEHFSQSNLF